MSKNLEIMRHIWREIINNRQKGRPFWKRIAFGLSANGIDKKGNKKMEYYRHVMLVTICLICSMWALWGTHDGIGVCAMLGSVSSYGGYCTVSNIGYAILPLHALSPSPAVIPKLLNFQLKIEYHRRKYKILKNQLDRFFPGMWPVIVGNSWLW